VEQGRRLLKIFSFVVTWLLIILVALMTCSLISMKATGGQPSIAGHRMYIVLSGSMEPAFKTGSLIFVKPTDPQNIEAGDIITYRGLGGSEALVSHRVVSVQETEAGLAFVTKGDANEVADPNPVPESHLIGRMTLAIPYLGYLLNLSQTRQGIQSILLLLGVILLIHGIYTIYKNSREIKRHLEAEQAKQNKPSIEAIKH
jgi:signal peptidase